MTSELTSTDFWERWWENSEFPIVPDPQKSYDRVFLEIFDRLSLNPEHRVFEVGCAPGKWLIHFKKRFGCQVEGCEISLQGLRVLSKNLAHSGVHANIIPGDFLTTHFSEGLYDVVLSLGFIEHFRPPWDVLRKHVDLIKPGGLLILEVPNFRGINRWFQRRSLLDAHNLDIMTKSFFRTVAEHYGLRIRFLDYLGGFEPANLDTHGRPVVLRALCSAIRRLHLLRSIRSPWWSGFLTGIFEKPGPDSGLWRDPGRTWERVDVI